MPINFIGNYWRDKYGERIQRVCLDVGFTCPNRDGSKGRGGCTFCRNDSFSPANQMRGESVTTQINKGIELVGRRYKAKNFLAYFQSYTNTYAPLDELKQLYLEALEHPQVIGLAIGTRPDCLPDDLLDFLQELNRKKEVYLELGIESLRDETLENINRGHGVAEFYDALERCHKRGLKVGAHLIIGLPGDNEAEWETWGDKLASLPLHSVKFHNLLVLKGTILGDEYNTASFKLLSEDEYLHILAKIIEHLPKGLYVDRVLAEAPTEMLVEQEKRSSSSDFKRRLLDHMIKQGMSHGSKSLEFI